MRDRDVVLRSRLSSDGKVFRNTTPGKVDGACKLPQMRPRAVDYPHTPTGQPIRRKCVGWGEVFFMTWATQSAQSRRVCSICGLIRNRGGAARIQRLPLCRGSTLHPASWLAGALTVIHASRWRHLISKLSIKRGTHVSGFWHSLGSRDAGMGPGVGYPQIGLGPILVWPLQGPGTLARARVGGLASRGRKPSGGSHSPT